MQLSRNIHSCFWRSVNLRIHLGEARVPPSQLPSAVLTAPCSNRQKVVTTLKRRAWGQAPAHGVLGSGVKQLWVQVSTQAACHRATLSKSLHCSGPCNITSLSGSKESGYDGTFEMLSPCWDDPCSGFTVTVAAWSPFVTLVVKNPPANAEDIRDANSIPGLGRSPREGNGKPLQYFCLGNPTDRGTWRDTVDGVTKSQTQQK